jgi:hypothetical protein
MGSRATAGRRQQLDTLADARRQTRSTAMLSTETYLQYPPLIGTLPALVKAQRTHEARIAAVAQDVKDDKTLRAQIDELLVRAGLQPGEAVTCLGYAVTHHQRDGQQKLNPDLLVAQLAAVGLEPDVIDDVLANSLETGPPACYASVKPSKGSTVRA